MTTIVVDTVTLEFMNYWPSSLVNPPVVTGPNPQVALETDQDPLILRAVRSDDGTIQLVEDPQKVEDHKAALWSQLRSKRNQLLAASDWTQFTDSPLSPETKAAWAQYRVALRNLPEVTQDPTQVSWPAQPI